jgi:hypothetical protein
VNARVAGEQGLLQESNPDLIADHAAQRFPESAWSLRRDL